MTESDWKFDHNEVLLDEEGYMWHVMHRRECIDCDNDRRYELADATHTQYKTVHADDAEGWKGITAKYESAGWECVGKPAVKRGVRINGALADPQSIPFWRGNSCQHEYPCPECGADCESVDILMTKTHLLTECRECHHWQTEALE